MSDESRPLSIPPVVICPECGADRQPNQTECWLCLGRKESISAEEAAIYFIDSDSDSEEPLKQPIFQSKPRPKSQAMIWALAAAMCLVIGVGIAAISIVYAIGFVISTVPVLCALSFVASFNRSESKEAALIAGLIQGVVAFMSATLILIGAVLLVLFAIFTAFLEICSGIMPSGP